MKEKRSQVNVIFYLRKFENTLNSPQTEDNKEEYQWNRKHKLKKNEIKGWFFEKTIKPISL